MKGRYWGGIGVRVAEKWTDKRYVLGVELFGIGKWIGCGEIEIGRCKVSGPVCL